MPGILESVTARSKALRLGLHGRDGFGRFAEGRHAEAIALEQAAQQEHQGVVVELEDALSGTPLAAGRSMVKQVPLPGWLHTWIRPPAT